MSVSSGKAMASRSKMTEFMAFSRQVICGRWFIFFSTILIMSVSGASYMFGLYSRDIKFVLGYDQSTLNLLSFFKDLGANFGVLSGLINEVTPPWVVLAIGGVLNFFGYFMVWLAVTKKIAKPQLWNMIFYIFIGANSHCSTNTGALVTSIKNFPGNRGIVLGFLSSYLGLSTAITTQLYYTFCNNDTKSLILLMACVPTAIAFAFLPVYRNRKSVQQPNDSKVLYRFIYVSLCLAVFLMIIIIVQATVGFKHSQYYGTTAGMLFLLVLPIYIVILEEYEHQKNNSAGDPSQPLKILTDKPVQKQSPSVPLAEQKFQTRTSCWSTILTPPSRGEDYTILQAVLSIDMMVLFFSTMCGIGGTLSVVNNLGQIGTSLGYPPHSVTTFASLLSIWIYLGKIVVGILSEHVTTKFKLPRPLVLTLLLLMSCVGHLLIAFDVSNGLYVASVVIGFCFGATWPLLFTIISELFGLKYYSTLYNIGSMASPVGVYLLSVRVVGHLYDKEAKKKLAALGIQRKAGEELNCNGVECFKLSFLIVTGVTLFGALVSLILVYRTRKFYRSDIYRKFREETRASEKEMALARNGDEQSSANGGH